MDGFLPGSMSISLLLAGITAHVLLAMARRHWGQAALFAAATGGQLGKGDVGVPGAGAGAGEGVGAGAGRGAGEGAGAGDGPGEGAGEGEGTGVGDGEPPAETATSASGVLLPPQAASQAEDEANMACNASRRVNWFIPCFLESSDGGLSVRRLHHEAPMVSSSPAIVTGCPCPRPDPHSRGVVQ